MDSDGSVRFWSQEAAPKDVPFAISNGVVARRPGSSSESEALVSVKLSEEVLVRLWPSGR